jgi:hypothetical protein
MRKEAGKLAPLLYVGQEDGGLPLAAREARAGLIKAAQQRLREIDAQLSSPASSDTLRMSLALQRNALQSDLNEVITGS